MEKIYNNQINANINSPICIVSNQDVILGSGTIELRKGSKTGELIESFNILSDRVSLSGREIAISPSSSLPYECEVYVLISDGAIISSINGSSFSGFDVNGDKEFKFTTEKEPIIQFGTEPEVGNFYEGGTIISKNNGIYVIVSTIKHKIELSWYEFSEAIQSVEKVTETTGWYVPSLHELQSYHEQLKSMEEELYWTGTEKDINTAYLLNMNSNVPYVANKNESHLIRLFKKVNY